MDSHPKKKKNQYKANQKSIHGHVVGRENQIQSIQSKSKPNPITQYCNTDLFINQKKKKNPIQRKPNPRPRANQTHGETPTVTSLAGATRFVARRPCLLVVDSSLVRPSQCRLWQWYLGKEKGVVVWWVLGSVESLGCSIVLHPLA